MTQPKEPWQALRRLVEDRAVVQARATEQEIKEKQKKTG